MADRPITERLRALSPARLRLGRAGSAVPTAAQLAFQLDRAQARDAVWTELETEGLSEAIGQPIVEVRSEIRDRTRYLRRPDLGRRLAETDADRLDPGPYDLAIVVADGLSAAAVHAHAASMVLALLDRLPDWHVAPTVVARQARVAIGDMIGERLAARLVCVLIGERPGLSSPASLGAYLTWEPREGRKDSERNCISNIQPLAGLSYDDAADRIVDLLRAATRKCQTGVKLVPGSRQAATLGSREPSDDT